MRARIINTKNIVSFLLTKKFGALNNINFCLKYLCIFHEATPVYDKKSQFWLGYFESNYEIFINGAVKWLNTLS